MTLTVDKQGFKKLEQTLRNLESQSERVGVEIVHAILHDVLHDSLQQVPSETGALASTATVWGPKVIDGQVVGRVGYDGEKAVNPRTGQPVSDYVVPVHERLDLHHPTGKAKFLEEPWNRHIKDLETKIGQKLTTRLVKGALL